MSWCDCRGTFPLGIVLQLRVCLLYSGGRIQRGFRGFRGNPATFHLSLATLQFNVLL